MTDWNNIVALALTFIFVLFILRFLQKRKAKSKNNYTWEPELDVEVSDNEYHSGISGGGGHSTLIVRPKNEQARRNMKRKKW